MFSFLAVSGFQLNLTVTNRKEFQVLTSVLPKQERLRLLNLHAKVQLLSWMVFSTGLAIPSIVSLTLDKTLGPIANLEFVCMLVRNLSVLVWGLVSFASNRIVLWQFNELMRSIADTQSRTALEKMRRDHHSMNRLLLGTGLVFALICIPPIWGYQTYVYALLLAIGTLRHPAYKLRHGEATSSSRDSKLLKSKDLAVAPVLGNDSDRLAEPVVLSALSSKAGDI